MADTLLYRAIYQDPNKDNLTAAEHNQLAGQGAELTPQKGEVWQMGLTEKGEDAYRKLFPDTPTRPGYNIDVNEAYADLRKNAREKERFRLQNQRAAEAQKKYQPLLEANAVKPRRELLTEQELLQKINAEGSEQTADNKRRLRMKHINGIYSKQIDALEKQREQLAQELDNLRSKGMIDNAKRAQFEELGKQIEVLNGKMYDGERAFKTFSESEETKENQLKLHNLYKQLSSPDLSEEQRQVISAQIKELESKVDQRAALDHWLAERKKEFEEHNAAIDKEKADIEAKRDAESTVKDGDIELEKAVNTATDGLFTHKQVEGKTARTRAQGTLIDKYKEKINNKDYRGAQLILEQHPDIAKMVGYDPVAQRKFNLRENTKKGINKAAERQEIVNGIKYTPEMKEDAVKAKEKYANMTDDDALEETRRAHRGLPPTGKAYKTKAEVKAEKEYRRKQELNAQEQQAKVNASRAALKSKLNNINNLVLAGKIKPEQANTLARNAMLEFNASASAAASKSPRTSTQAPEVTSKGGPRTFTNKGNANAVSDIVKLRDAELLNDYNKLDKADQAAIFIQNNGDFKKLPADYRTALIDKYGYGDADPKTIDTADENGDGELSDEEAKAANLRVRTTFDKDGNPTRNFYAQTIDFDKLDSGGVKSFFNRGDEQLDKLRRFTRLAPQQTALFSKQYAAEQKQQLAQGLAKAKLESEQANSGYKTATAQAEVAAKKVFADSSYKLSNADYKAIAAISKEKNIPMEQAAKLHLENQLGKTSLPDVKDTTVNRNKFAQYGEQWLKLSGDQKLSVLNKEKDLTQKAAVLGLAKKDDESGKIIPISPSEIKKDNLVQLKQLAKEENDFLDEAGLPKDSGYWGRALRNFVGTGLEAEIAELENWLKNQTDVPKHYQPRYKSWFDALENLPERHRNFDYIGNKFREEYLPHRPQSEIDRIYKEYLKSIGRDEWDVLLPDQSNELSKRLKSDHENYFFNVYLPKYQKLLKLREELAKNGK